jgi:hypothetical protein
MVHSLMSSPATFLFLFTFLPLKLGAGVLLSKVNLPVARDRGSTTHQWVNRGQYNLPADTRAAQHYIKTHIGSSTLHPDTRYILYSRRYTGAVQHSCYIHGGSTTFQPDT